MSLVKKVGWIVLLIGLILVGYGVMDYADNMDQVVNKPRAELRNSSLNPVQISARLNWGIQLNYIVIGVGIVFMGVGGIAAFRRKNN
jgi:hypothetical protein